MQWKLTRREFGKIILPALPLIAMPRLALAAADKWMGMDVTKLKSINGLGVGSIKNHSGVELAAGGCIQIFSSAGQTATGSWATARYAAQARSGNCFTLSAATDICQVDWVMGATAGNIVDLMDFCTEIWSITAATDNLGTLIGRSDRVVGVNWALDTTVEYTFTTKPSLSASTRYAVILKAVAHDAALTGNGTYDGTNYPSLRYIDTGSTSEIDGAGRWEYNSGTVNNYTASREYFCTVYGE